MSALLARLRRPRLICCGDDLADTVSAYLVGRATETDLLTALRDYRAGE